MIADVPTAMSCKTRGGYREWSDRIPTGAIPERSERNDGRRVDDVSRRDLETSSLASWSRALDDQRRELLAGVGHELKTPLSIVLGLCGRLLAAADLGDEQTEDVQRIRANAYVLLKRVEELLQVSRLDGGHLELEPRDVDVARLVRSSCEGFASVAELREQRLVIEAPPRLPARLDEEKVLSVVSNLLANALKYAPPGGIVRCTVADAGERLRIEVADSGPGVDDGLRETIFERYRRGAGSAARPGGTGLGLAIVRDLVALHNGMVTLTDAPEGGAALRRRPARQRRPRGRRRARGDPGHHRRGGAPARDRRAPAGRARGRRAPRRAVPRDRGRRRPSEHPHRQRRLRARRLHGGAHPPPLRGRARGGRARGRAPDRRPAPRRRRARRGRRDERHRRAAPAPWRGPAA